VWPGARSCRAWNSGRAQGQLQLRQDQPGERAGRLAAGLAQEAHGPFGDVQDVAVAFSRMLGGGQFGRLVQVDLGEREQAARRVADRCRAARSTVAGAVPRPGSEGHRQRLAPCAALDQPGPVDRCDRVDRHEQVAGRCPPIPRCPASGSRPGSAKWNCCSMLPVHFLVQVDQEVAAADQVEPRERRIVQQVMVR
jgi:hypothetical protein